MVLKQTLTPELQALSQLSFGVTAALCGIRRANIFSVLKSAQNRKGWLGGVIKQSFAVIFALFG